MFSPAASSCPSSRPLGAWRLHPGQAMSLHPRATSVLRIHRGRVWVTLGQPSALTPQGSGDRFLHDGQTLVVPAGARMVLEPLSSQTSDGPVCFDWSGAMPLHESRFGREVRAPLHEAATAFAQATWALLRVARGLLGYSEFLVAGRGRVLSPLETLR